MARFRLLWFILTGKKTVSASILVRSLWNSAVALSLHRHGFSSIASVTALILLSLIIPICFSPICFKDLRNLLILNIVTSGDDFNLPPDFRKVGPNVESCCVGAYTLIVKHSIANNQVNYQIC
ncbi:hypothetical protein SDJN02_24346, partial [Cucurbita argyrosperma subsp. argyrosperma]